MKRGEIYWADLLPRSGSEQTGRRPVLVILNDGLTENSAWQSLVVIPFTTSERQLRGPSVVFLEDEVPGLRKESVIICHQITTLDRSKFLEKIGQISDEDLQRVGDALKKTLELR